MPPPRMGMIQISVLDLAEAKRFYGEVLGMRVNCPFGPERPFLLEVEGAPAVLIYRAGQATPDTYPTGTGSTLIFHTDDLPATIEQWRAAGVEFVSAPNSRHPLGIGRCPFGEYIAFRDPSGNVHELLQPVDTSG